MDHLTPAARSANMAKVKSQDTRPELLIRQALHAMGYRFSLHRNDLPGRPYIVLRVCGRLCSSMDAIGIVTKVARAPPCLKRGALSGKPSLTAQLSETGHRLKA